MQFSKFPAFITPDGRKVPLHTGWKLEATTEQKQLDAWEAHYRPGLGDRFLFGIPCGEVNGIYALDIDIKGNGWQTIQEHQLQIPDTPHQKTRSGGSHIIFKYPKGSGLGNPVKFLPGLDARGEGGWIADYGLTVDRPIADIPEWLLQAVVKRHAAVAPTPGDSPYLISQSVAARMISEMLQLVRTAPEGEGNNVLNAQAFEMGRVLTTRAISREEAELLLYNAAIERGRGDYEARATIKSGLDSGSVVPLTCPFGVPQPMQGLIPAPPGPASRWTPRQLTVFDLLNTSKLKRPQLYADWSTRDISIVNADGGTGKTTMLLQEAVCMAIGERFMGLECREPGGKTLFITGEDTAEKLAAILGQIMKQMGMFKDPNDTRVQKVLDCVLIKNEYDMCFVTKTQQGFYVLDPLALAKVREACEDIRPMKVVIDPFASFSGPESAANDTAQASIKFARSIVREFDCCFEFVNHLAKEASRIKDMTQFGGRGASAIPSHSRVSKSMRRLGDEELKDYLDFDLEPEQTAVLVMVNKFTDGSPLYMKPFVMIREGYMFSRYEINKAADVATVDHITEVFNWVKKMRADKKYPSKPVIYSQFMGKAGFSKQKITDTINHLQFFGHEGVRFCIQDHPNATDKTKVIVLINEDGVEV